MKRIALAIFALLFAACPAVNYPNGHGGTGNDDYNPVHPVPTNNSSYASDMTTFLSSEEPAERTEYGFQNFVKSGCLGAAGAGLTMTPTSCIAYNANIRGTETGSITFADNSTTWVAMDENITGSNANLPNFSRVAGTHYLIDAIDTSPPTMTSDSQLLMKVVTLSGAITAVTDVRNLTPEASGQSQGTNGLFNTITGTGTAPVIASLNGVRDNEKNVMAYGASGAGVDVTTATGTSGQATITVASATGWKVGQGIIVHHGGAAVTLATPGAPTVTPKGTTGASTCTYAIRALTAKRGYTVAGTTGTTASCNATQTLTNYNQLSWTAVASAWGYAVERTTPNAALIAVTTDTHAVDIGQTAPYATIQTFAEIPSGTAGTGADWLQTTISAINGTTFTLAANLGSTLNANSYLNHDDTAAITNAWNAATAAGDVLYFPAGNYFFAGTPLSSGNVIRIASAQNASRAYIADNQYLILQTAQMQGPGKIEGMEFVGGLGAYHNTSLASQTSPNNAFEFINDRFFDFTGVATGIEPGDVPRLLWNHCFYQALDEKQSMGILVPGSWDNQIVNTQFQNVRIGIKSVGGTGVMIQHDTFLSAEPIQNAQAPRIGVWVTPPGSQFGEVHITANKFGNENLSADDMRIAFLDDGAGADESTKMPNFATGDDMSMTASSATLTSASECPFTSAMCQGGAGCTGSAGNWSVVVQAAGRGLDEVSDGLTSTISAFTDTCHVTLAANANTTVSAQIARMAPTGLTGLMGAQISRNDSIGIGFTGSAPFVVSTAEPQSVQLSYNSFTGGLPSEVWEQLSVPPQDVSRYNIAANNTLGSITANTPPGQQVLCNIADIFNIVVDPGNYFSRTATDALQIPYPLTDAGASANLETILAGSCSAANGASFIGNVTDSFGKTNGDAGEFAVVNGGTIGCAGLNTTVANVPIWIYFETHSGSSSPVNRMLLTVLNNADSQPWFQRGFTVTTGWQPHLYKFVPNVVKTWAIALQGLDTGRIQIGRVRAYQGWAPPPMIDETVNGQLKVTSSANIVGGVINGCKGDVTLAAGSGTFSNACVAATSACDAKDITTPTNTCTVAAPAAGSVGITGTGTDHCRVWCE